jgi:hypothetical protein
MTVKEIRVLKRPGHELADDVKECLACLTAAGIGGPRMGGIHPGYGTIRDVEDEDEDRAIQILRAKGFDVVAGSRAYASYKQ